LSPCPCRLSRSACSHRLGAQHAPARACREGEGTAGPRTGLASRVGGQQSWRDLRAPPEPGAMGRAARGLCNITYECVSTPAEGRRIALMGWSHGAATTLFAVDDIYLAGAELRSDLRQRAVAAFGQHLAGVLLLLLDAPNDVLHHRRERGGVADPLGDSVGDLEAPL